MKFSTVLLYQIYFNNNNNNNLREFKDSTLGQKLALMLSCLFKHHYQ